MATLVFILTGFDCITIIFLTLVRFYLETHKTVNTDQKYLWNVIVLQEINQLCEITKPQTAMVIVCVFKVCLRILNFIVIGQYTINIPEIFQVFRV